MAAGLAGTVVFGLAASACWGCSDFGGGLAARRAGAGSVVVAVYAVGLVLLAVLAVLGREPFPRPIDLVWAGLAGLMGTAGLLAFYTALASGKMGLAAPVAALLTAALPVLFGLVTAGWPGLPQIGGFVLAGFALALITGPERAGGSPKALGAAVLAGIGFGGFFILISRIGPASTLWSLTMSRALALVPLIAWVRLRRGALAPGRENAHLVVVAGVLDALGNVFFVAAAHTGRIDIAAVLASLYPAATIGLSRLVLGERVKRTQAVGILLALLAVPLFSA